MSLITHRCTTCGHPDYWRLERQQDRCPQCNCRCTPGEPTFDLAGQPVEAITKPGAKTGFGVSTHNCERCRELYAELTGAAA